MPRHQGVWRVAWGHCDRCGFEHPVTWLVKHKGMKVCNCHGCVDDLIVERRQQRIAEILRAPANEGGLEIEDETAIPEEYDVEF